MFPNPQDALPLPPGATLDDFERFADGDLQRWLAAIGVPPGKLDEVKEFAGRERDTRMVIARSHGFRSWGDFARHFNARAQKFETAADAIVTGDIDTLKRLLAEEPRLVRARSMREHNATLLIYTSANGVEGYRQKTPANIVATANLLLDAG
jgi:hypothetical protein